MSIAAMNWAWQTTLQPTQKLVLMSLADSADEKGICWPSVTTVAKKCSISQRTAQRIISLLKAKGLLSTRSRFRADGSRTSNQYQLSMLSSPVNLSPHTENNENQPGQAKVPGHVTDDVLTTMNQKINPPPQVDTCGGEYIFHKNLTKNQIDALKEKLMKIDNKVGQAILDELAGRMQIVEIKNPIRYCAILIERANSNQFTSELGIKIAETRRILAARAREIEMKNEPIFESKKQVSSDVEATIKDALAILKRTKK